LEVISVPAPTPADLGPLAALVGTWEGTDGLDLAFNNESGKVKETPFRERVVMNPFGPVDNGSQCLFGLDYRMAAWRDDDPDPFHTEVGYWLWDEADGQVMRCFMVPRGSTLIAGGRAKPDSTSFSMQAEVGSESYGILSNLYLAASARTTLYQCTVELGDGTWSYDETTTVELTRMPGTPFAHTDRNTMHRVADGASGPVAAK
jgi:hypothetical protein